MFGKVELLLILLVIFLVLFDRQALPKLARNASAGFRALQRSLHDRPKPDVKESDPTA